MIARLALYCSELLYCCHSHYQDIIMTCHDIIMTVYVMMITHVIVTLYDVLMTFHIIITSGCHHDAWLCHDVLAVPGYGAIL